MTLWIIEPQDPFIVRDGRPFPATPGARAHSLPFPFPSTTTGGVRTRAGQNADGLFNNDNLAAVSQINVRGPLLVEQDAAGTWQFLAPAPADALVFDAAQEAGKVERKWLRPLTLPPGSHTDKPTELPYLVGLPHPDNRKPAKNAPSFWHWPQFAAWLTHPDGANAPLPPLELGHNGPQPDRRIHVGIDPHTFTGLDGALFATSGLTFWQRDPARSWHRARKLALAVDVAGDLNITPGFAPLGGERRLMYWQNPANALPTPPETLIQTIAAQGGHCRLILLTPAYFAAGWRPTTFGPGVTLLATAVPTPNVVSGWDFAQSSPKATRRLAPAGSVYFVQVKGDIASWVNSRWLQPLSDDLAMGQAGFGLTAVGVWDGTAPELKIMD